MGLQRVGGFANNATIEASGGTLDVTGNVTGGGQLLIDAGTTLELGGPTTETVSFSGSNGTLKLDHPQTAAYTGTIFGFAQNDTLDLSNADLGAGNFATSANATFNPANNTSTLTVNLKSGGPLTYALSGNYSTTGFSVMPNTPNDSFIIISQPVLAGAGNTVGYTEGGSATVIDSGLTVSDASSTTLASATVSISGGFFAGDQLNFTNQNGITGSYNAATGVLSLSGSSSVANYQTALDSVTFSSSSQNPTNFGADTSRTINWLANDGTTNSNTVASTVNVTAVDNAPVLGGPGTTVSYTQGGAATVIDSGLTASDVDNQNLASATVAISSGFFAGDQLNFTNQNGITGSYNAATGVLSLSGSSSVANYQAALDSVTYSSTSGNPTNGGTDTSRTISWLANDGTLNSNTVTSTVNITAVTPGPVLAGAGNTVGYTEGGSATVIDSGLTVSDARNTTLASATVSISSGFFAGDQLNFTNQNGITGSYNAATGELSLSGSSSVANYQAALFVGPRPCRELKSILLFERRHAEYLR